MRVERMRHPEERDGVAGRNLEVREILHVCLGTAAAIEELVDVEDPHLVKCPLEGATVPDRLDAVKLPWSDRYWGTCHSLTRSLFSSTTNRSLFGPPSESPCGVCIVPMPSKALKTPNVPLNVGACVAPFFV